MNTPCYQLVIGTKATSSWSLRPWLLMRRLQLPFREVRIPLYAEDTRQRILQHSPSGFVPALKDGEQVIWDSLAIAEHLADTHPALAMWPREQRLRSMVRSVAAEMHSGFRELRLDMPFAILEQKPRPPSSVPEAVGTDIRRIVRLWRDCRSGAGASATGGPFLFGPFTIADAMYAPVASRFRTYLPDLAPYGDTGTAATYVATLMALPEIGEWIAAAKAETFS